MCTRSVPKSAGRRSGMKLTSLAALLLMQCSCSGAQELPNIQDDPSRIYVLSGGRGCKITTYTMDGKQTDPEIPIGGFDCTGIAMDAEGRLLVSVRSRGVVSFAPNGKATLVLGSSGASALALDESGNIHLLIAQDMDNWLLRRYKPDGTVIAGQTSIQMNNVCGIAVDRSGRTFAVSQGNQVVRIFGPDGQMQVQTIKTGSTPRAVALGPDGKIYVANFLSVTSFFPDGKPFLPPLKHQNPNTLGLDTPTALTVDANGRLYVGYDTGYVGIIDGKSPRPAFMAREDIRGIAVR
jgi:DNA-binding beta-propeller fold protein YncE